MERNPAKDYSGLTQTEQVIQYMKEFGSITPLEAYQDLGIMRLSARIYDLRQAGTQIDDDKESRKNRFGVKTQYKRYWLC